MQFEEDLIQVPIGGSQSSQEGQDEFMQGFSNADREEGMI